MPKTVEERKRALIKNEENLNYWKKKALEFRCETEETYLEFLWQQTQQKKDFTSQKILAKMDEKELLNYQTTRKTLEKNNIPYTEHELLLSRQFWGMEDLHGGTICKGHAYPYSINPEIRAEKGDISFNDLPLECRILDRALETIAPTECDLTVYRGVSSGGGNGSFIKKLLSMKKGETFTDKAYSYSSFSKSVGNSWAGDCFLEIRVPKGARVSRAIASEQSELLFPRNSQFKVIEEALPTENGKHKIVLEYILPKN